MTKADLRRSMKAVLGRMEARTLAEGGAAAARRLEAADAWKHADLVLAFLSMPGEIDTAPLIAAARRAGKAVAVPGIEGDLLRFRLMPAGEGALPRDRWGIPVPDPRWPAADLAGRGPRQEPRRVLIVVPGLAFDREGNRLGRGKGFYDRFLAESRRARPAAIGFCLAAQLVDSVPVDAHDVPVDGVVTDGETLAFSALT